jgi:hypothetical protein
MGSNLDQRNKLAVRKKSRQLRVNLKNNHPNLIARWKSTSRIN